MSSGQARGKTARGGDWETCVFSRAVLRKRKWLLTCADRLAAWPARPWAHEVLQVPAGRALGSSEETGSARHTPGPECWPRFRLDPVAAGPRSGFPARPGAGGLRAGGPHVREPSGETSRGGDSVSWQQGQKPLEAPAERDLCSRNSSVNTPLSSEQVHGSLEPTPTRAGAPAPWLGVAHSWGHRWTCLLCLCGEDTESPAARRGACLQAVGSGGEHSHPQRRAGF